MQAIFFVGIGGALGAISRYLISQVSIKIWGDTFPIGTLIVNVLGCFLIGFFMTSLFNSGKQSSLMPFLIPGLMGGFTTFSAFSYETINFFANGAYLKGVLNISLSLILCFASVALGMFIGKFIVNK